MKLEKADIINFDDIELCEISDEYCNDMINLHDNIFKKAYYSGKTIIKRINENRKVFIASDSEKLVGYI